MNCRRPSPRVRNTSGISNEEAVVRGTFEALSEARGTPIAERDALLERWFDREVEYVEEEKWPGSSAYRGRDAVRDAFAGYEEILGGDLTVEEMRTGTNGLLAVIRFEGREGRISYFRAFADLGEARAAAGVSSP